MGRNWRENERNAKLWEGEIERNGTPLFLYSPPNLSTFPRSLFYRAPFELSKEEADIAQYYTGFL